MIIKVGRVILKISTRSKMIRISTVQKLETIVYMRELVILKQAYVRV